MRNYLPLALFWMTVTPAASFGQTASQADPDPVAIVAGQPISQSDLDAAVGPQQLMQLRKQEYEIKNKALENLVRLKVVQAQAKRLGVTPEELVQREADSKVADPGEAEVEAFFLGQAQPGARFNDVKEQYRTALKQMRIQKARQAYADSLRAKTDVSIKLRPPVVEVAYDPSRVKGDPNAPVTIVEFSDFQCHFCKEAVKTLNSVLTKYNGRVKLAFLDFPLRSIHPLAESAAEAARCAGEQGRFWEFHDALFADQSRMKEADLAERARALGLNEKSFQGCIASGTYKAKIEADLQQGTKAGIAGTPGFFVNGVFLSRAQPQAEFERIIENELSLLGMGQSGN